MSDLNVIINEKELRIFAIKRSGQHAVMQWLADNCMGRAVLVNTAKLYQNIYLNTRDSHLFKNNLLTELDIESERAGEFSRKNVLVWNQESVELDKFDREDLDRHHDDRMGKSANISEIILLRDPVNMLASHYYRYKINPSTQNAARYFFKLRELWKQYAREFLGETDFLPGNKIPISYNSWVKDPAYRRDALLKLGIDPPEEEVDPVRVPKMGGGSSFDGTRYSKKVSRMKVLRRWEVFRDDQLYMSFFDEELLCLCERIFDMREIKEAVSRIRKTSHGKLYVKSRYLMLDLKFWVPFNREQLRKRSALLLYYLKRKFPGLYDKVHTLKNRRFNREHR